MATLVELGAKAFNRAAGDVKLVFCRMFAVQMHGQRMPAEEHVLINIGTFRLRMTRDEMDSMVNRYLSERAQDGIATRAVAGSAGT